MKAKFILIPLFSLVAIGGVVLIYLSIKKNKNHDKTISKDKGKGGSNTDKETDNNDVKTEEVSDKSLYSDDTKMVLLMVYGFSTDVFKDKNASEILKTSKTVVGYTSLSEYENAELNDYIDVYAYLGIDSDNNAVYKKGYVKKYDTTHSSYTTYDKLRKFLKLK